MLLSAAQVAALVDQFAAVYRAAFASAPYHRQEQEVIDFARSLAPQTERPDFRSAAARDAATGLLVGFAYGYRSKPGQWWYDNVSLALGQKTAAEWLADAFQVTEIAVAPAYQGQGVGSALLDLLLRDVRHGRAVLSTIDTETVARRLYRNRGWQDLLNGFHFPGVSRPYAIMGRRMRSDEWP